MDEMHATICRALRLEFDDVDEWSHPWSAHRWSDGCRTQRPWRAARARGRDGRLHCGGHAPVEELISDDPTW